MGFDLLLSTEDVGNRWPRAGRSRGKNGKVGRSFGFARVRSLERKAWKHHGLSEPVRTRANIARTCHAEGRGFESNHPLVYPAKRHLWVSLRTTDDLLHALRETSSAL